MSCSLTPANTLGETTPPSGSVGRQTPDGRVHGPGEKGKVARWGEHPSWPHKAQGTRTPSGCPVWPCQGHQPLTGQWGAAMTHFLPRTRTRRQA